MVELLDPKLDVVFKMLFAERRNEALLRSLLTSVLRPSSPIASVRVLDPELPKELATDRGVRLDMLVELDDGRLVNVEMECDARRALGERWLYHWARLFAGRLRRGDDYENLLPVVCIVFVAARSRATRFHSVYRAGEIHDGTLLSDALEVHVVELPRLAQAADEAEPKQLERWARFLRFESTRELELLATEDPVMAEAKSAIEILSREPSAQRIAEMRAEAEIERRLDRAIERKEGRKEGREEGRAEGLRSAIPIVCEALTIGVDAARMEQLAQAGVAELERILDALRTKRAWPE